MELNKLDEETLERIDRTRILKANLEAEKEFLLNKIKEIDEQLAIFKL